MASEAHKFQVGLFVIGATAIAIFVLIWLGASRFFERNYVIATYFSESVQGLEPGAAVKYRGVPAGRVQRIGIAPDGSLIEVLMDIDTEFADKVRTDASLRAQLQLTGITGLRYIEIDRHRGQALKQAPQLTFEPRYPVIPSTSSDIKAIQSALGDIYQKVMSVDLAGISADVRTMLQAANELLSDERVDSVLTDLRSTSASVAQVARNFETMTEGVRLGPAVKNLEAASGDARALLADLRGNVHGSELRSAIAQVSSVGQSVHQLLAALQYTIERVDRSLGNVERLTEQLQSQPSLLLFSGPRAAEHPGSREQ